MIVKTNILRELLYGTIEEHLGLHVVKNELVDCNEYKGYSEKRLILKDRPTGRFFALEYYDDGGKGLGDPFAKLVVESFYEDEDYYGAVELNNYEVEAVIKQVVVYE